MRPEWKDRLTLWRHALLRDLYEPLGAIVLEGFETDAMLTPEAAERQTFAPMPEGHSWGHAWGYAWMRGDIAVDDRAAGQRLVMSLCPGGEATLFVNGEVFGTRRAEWVKEAHHYLCDQILTDSAKPGDTFHLLMEVYAGHEYPENPAAACATGPIRGETGEYDPQPPEALRRTIGANTWGIWHEEAYQLWLDVTTLHDVLISIDETSLRAAKIEEALEAFMLTVDFEQPRASRLADYAKARQLLRPAMEAVNGSTMPTFAAIGNAHLDMCWLWPYRETQRKVARTFAQQVRLMDLYPDYQFLQSQPESYLICKQLYPRLYERIKEKIKTGQWIADGSMWVEPDTNMSGGEALIRQLIHGKRFYLDEFGVDCRLLWLPDTFGYSAVLPQLLKGCGVQYLTTQKIFWTYNDSDRFPYHYFTWQGMDGSEVTSFLHMDYTSRTDAATVIGRWRDRVQKRDLTRFLLPFGYGDGGGGPTRDHIEFVRREQNLESVPKVHFQAPQAFFEECADEGAPANRYVGELYFQCHRGTYTSQASIKRGNRRAELDLREAELWASVSPLAVPLGELDAAWKKVLSNQFHDILPGSSIAKVYEFARERYAEVKTTTDRIIRAHTAALTNGQTGTTYFNSLSWERRQWLPMGDGCAQLVIPPMGMTSRLTPAMPAHPAAVRMENGCAVLSNGLLTAVIRPDGSITSLKDARGQERISAPANSLRLYKDVPRTFDAWDIDSNYDLYPVELEPTGQLEIVQNHPAACAVRVTRNFGQSGWVQEIRLAADSLRLDFDTEVDWQEQHRLLKVAFPTGVHADEAINEIQFGFVKRPTHHSRPYDADRFEVCNHRYTALCDEHRGAAVLNDCKYGVSQLGDTIALTLLRAATSPDRHADVGQHSFGYSYLIWDGSFFDSDVVHQGYERNVPIQTAPGQAPDTCFFAVDAPNVVLETVKPAEDGSPDLVLRLYECKHAATEAELTVNLPCRAAFLCDMLENEQEELAVTDGKLRLSFRAFEIKTIRIKLK